MNISVQALKFKLKEYRRIIKIARKPTKNEFAGILKVCGAGILLVGFIGFVLQMIYQLIT